MRLNQGRLIVFEGVDNSGKSTQIKHLYERLREEGISAASISFTEQAWFCEEFARQSSAPSASQEIEFFAWAINKLVDHTIIPLLREGKVVLVDRYSLSYFAYQSFHEVDQTILASNLSRDMPAPDLLIILDVPLETVLKRFHNKASQMSDADQIPFALNAIERLTHAAAYYKFHAPPSALVVDGELPTMTLAEQTWHAVKQLLEKS